MPAGWRFSDDAEPNQGHLALAQLEQRGLVATVITQNVDGLHTAAGSRDVIEVHGSIAQARCLSCGVVADRDQVAQLLPVPHCPACGTVLKPDVVMFGELLSAAVFERAAALARDAALLLVVGSSLEVWPVAGLPEETLHAGGKLAIVNRDATPYDQRAALVAHAAAGDVLAACVAVLAD